MEACSLWEIQDELRVASPSDFAAKLEKVTDLACYALYIVTDYPELSQNLESYISHWQFVAPYTDGNHLRSLGIQPGPIYSEILGKLRAAWLDGEISTYEEEQDLLYKLLNSKNLERIDNDHS
jgi:tRNA nucleotidyltransferase (CCA-adding enzyme)